MQQPPLAPGDEMVLRFRPKRSLLIVGCVLAIVGLAVAASLAVAGVLLGRWGPPTAGTGKGIFALILLGVFVGGACELMAYPLFRQGWLAPVLTTRQVLSPGAHGPWQAVDLADVSGVGLRYSVPVGRQRDRWTLTVWRDGDDHRIELCATAKGEHGGLTGRERQDAQGNWRHLADTHAGRTALRINHQALVVQGPDGPLARHRREKSAPAADSFEVGYWSPDGTMGPLR